MLMGAAHNALWAFNARVAGADHGYCEIKRRTRQNNLQSATVSLQVVIGLCRRKETAALKIKAAVSNGRVKLSALRRLFSFAVVRQNGLVIISEWSPLLLV